MESRIETLEEKTEQRDVWRKKTDSVLSEIIEKLKVLTWKVAT